LNDGGKNNVAVTHTHTHSHTQTMIGNWVGDRNDWTGLLGRSLSTDCY
jgi:hypothetical protein